MKTLFFLVGGLAVLGAGCASDESRAFDYWTPYHRPLVSPGAQFGALPAAVQNSVRAQVGATEITDVKRDSFDHKEIYKISFRNETLWPTLFVGADGSIYDPNMRVVVPSAGIGGDVSHGAKVTNLQVSDLPTEAIKALREHAPDSDVLEIERQPWGNQSVYVITFKDPKKNSKLFVTTEGVVLKDIGK